jgi:single-strand DNA-binding protein
MNAFHLRLHAPLPPFTPGLVVFSWGKQPCFPSFLGATKEETAMKDLNTVHLIGRLGQDPEVHYSDTGTARTTFSIATNRCWTDADGEVQTETEWTRCTTWGTLAEIGAQYVHKGSRVYVAGRLHTSRWMDRQVGEQDPSEAQPAQSSPVPVPDPGAQQPIRRPPQPVHLRTTSATDTTSGTQQQPSKRRSHER